MTDKSQVQTMWQVWVARNHSPVVRTYGSYVDWGSAPVGTFAIHADAVKLAQALLADPSVRGVAVDQAM